MAARATPGRPPAPVLLAAAPEDGTRPPCAAVGGCDGGGGVVDEARADDGACFVDAGLLLPFLFFAMFLFPPQNRVPSWLCLLDRRCARAGEPLAVSKAAVFPAKGEDTGGSGGVVEFARPQNDASPCERCSASVAFEPCSCAWHGPGRRARRQSQCGLWRTWQDFRRRSRMRLSPCEPPDLFARPRSCRSDLSYADQRRVEGLRTYRMSAACLAADQSRRRRRS